ncbi:MAG TPA: guanylate kinase [Thermomicrobiales bacterium]|nr:guanylate kinase [Thermomicrobiales bacterium]
MSTQETRADEIIADLRAVARPRLIVISGPSGVGKDTIIDRMRALHPEMHFAVTATTRPRRPGEIDGIHYYFYDREEFEAKLEAGEFMESAEVYGNLYGVPRPPVRNAIARGQDVVVKVDPQGAKTLREIAPAGIFIFIAPPSLDELAQRLRTRKTDEPDVLFARLQTAQRELATAGLFDYVVFNESDRQDDTVDAIMAILRAEKQRIHQPRVEV